MAVNAVLKNQQLTRRSPIEATEKLAVAGRLTDTDSTVGTWGRVDVMGGGPDVLSSWSGDYR